METKTQVQIEEGFTVAVQTAQRIFDAGQHSPSMVLAQFAPLSSVEYRLLLISPAFIQSQSLPVINYLTSDNPEVKRALEEFGQSRIEVIKKEFMANPHARATGYYADEQGERVKIGNQWFTDREVVNAEQQRRDVARKETSND